MSAVEVSQTLSPIVYRYSRRNLAAYCFDVLSTGAGLSFTGALLTDFVYSKSPDMQWTNFSAWLLFFGMVFATAAGFFGIISLIIERPRRISALAWLYVLIVLCIYVLAFFNNLVHSRDAWASVVSTGLSLSAATFCFVILAAIFRASASTVYRVRD